MTGYYSSKHYPSFFVLTLSIHFLFNDLYRSSTWLQFIFQPFCPADAILSWSISQKYSQYEKWYEKERPNTLSPLAGDSCPLLWLKLYFKATTHKQITSVHPDMKERDFTQDGKEKKRINDSVLYKLLTNSFWWPDLTIGSVGWVYKGWPQQPAAPWRLELVLQQQLLTELFMSHTWIITQTHA